MDFTKGVLISLMVLFHLAYFNECMPSGTTTLIYTFHMPGFLLISGFFSTVSDPIGRLRKLLRGILIPYVLFEAVYLIGLGLVGKMVAASNQFELSVGNLIEAICVHPVGTYWYLHTLIICLSIYALLSIEKLKIKGVNAIVLSAILCWALSFAIDGLHWENCMYFFIGAYLRLICKDIKQIIMPSWVAALGFVVLCFAVEHHDRNTLGGLFITIASLSFLFTSSKFIGKTISGLFKWFGRNSLSIVLMSPLYMIPSKFYARYFAFDTTGLVFGLFSLLFIVALCLLSAKIIDKSSISNLLFGKSLYCK